MPQKKVNYFQSELVAPEEYTTGLFCMPYRYIPIIIAALETRKARSFWASQDDFVRGYEVLSEVQLMLLQGCGDAIVNNIIALRGIDPSSARDEIYGTPLAPPQGSTVLDLFTTLQTPIGTPGAALGAIQVATEKTAVATEKGLLDEVEGELVPRLVQLALLL